MANSSNLTFFIALITVFNCDFLMTKKVIAVNNVKPSATQDPLVCVSKVKLKQIAQVKVIAHLSQAFFVIKISDNEAGMTRSKYKAAWFL